MDGIISVLKDLYIRMMVWLGAAPPSGYEHLVEKKPSAKKPAKPAPAKPPQKVEPPPVKPKPVAPPKATSPEPIKIEPKPVAPAKPEPPAPVKVEPTPVEPAKVAPPEPIKIEPKPVAPAKPEPPAPVKIEPEPVAPVKTTPPEPIKIEPKPVAPAKPVPPAPVKVEPKPAPPERLTVDRNREWLEARKPTPQEQAQAPKIAPPPPTVPAAEMVFKYEVQRGDTLNAVARKYGLTVKELLEANAIDDADRIYPGQKLVIPGYMLPGPELETEAAGVVTARTAPAVGDQFVYTVAGGDTLNTIAKRYGTTVRELIEANNLADPQRIHVGQKLVIPGVLKSAKAEVETNPNFPPIGPLTAVRALYVSYFATGHQETREQILQLLATTELNAVVIDAKSNEGWLTYPTQNSLAHEIGADRPAARDFEVFMQQLKDREIYTIARIVTFKDPLLAAHQPELAVKTDSGALWQDGEKSYWCDPFLQPIWEYNIQLAAEAAHLGFDEIQFDAVRFPTKSQAGTPQFSQDATKESRVAAITGFLSMARGQLAPFGVKISARASGYTCWRKDDNLIGQDIERMSEYLDVLCPMLYPSTFHVGIPGYKIPVAYPYEVVFESAKQAVERLNGLNCVVRPWLQDFQDYRFDKRTYRKDEIQAQIKGCFDAGSEGFMVWNPNAKYTAAAYAPVKTKS